MAKKFKVWYDSIYKMSTAAERIVSLLPDHNVAYLNEDLLDEPILHAGEVIDHLIIDDTVTVGFSYDIETGGIGIILTANGESHAVIDYEMVSIVEQINSLIHDSHPKPIKSTLSWWERVIVGKTTFGETYE